VKSITKDWIGTAKLDIEAMESMIRNERLTGHIAFHAQQAIEKSLKAVIEEDGERVPKIHSLSKLIELCTPFIKLSLNEDIIIALDSLYIESRYPGEFGLLPEGKPDLKQAYKFYESAKMIYSSILNYLESK